jgi:tRNA-2-methylthio-N6-dimethylallyladenosine synthase
MKRLYIDTVGCQMNALDSELVAADLRNHDFEPVDRPGQADVILFNTCSVRQHAEEKVYSNLGRLRQLKRENPDKVIGVIGCMAQNHQQRVFKRAPFVDIVVGPGQLHQLPQLIEKVARGEGRQMEVSLGRKDGDRVRILRSHESFDPLRDPQMRPTPFQAYVRTQIGCDKFCTYCIVPSVRGPEQARSPEEILTETRHLAEHGCLEITLLGQTVNSYRYKEGEKTVRLADLLSQMHDIDGLERIKFVTNFPKDMTDDLLSAVRDLKKVSPYLHVPAQSGSTDVLKRMKRGYTAEEYREMMDRINEQIPNSAVSSDFIVGFCGETEDEYQKTVDLVRDCRFKNSFIFKYSVREGTKADQLFEDDVPDDVKRRRNNELLALQNEISEEDNQTFVGRSLEVLVEGFSKAATDRGETEGSSVQLTGRAHDDRIVVFQGNPRQVGQILPVTICDCTAHTLIGEVVTQEIGPEVYTLST